MLSGGFKSEVQRFMGSVKGVINGTKKKGVRARISSTDGEVMDRINRFLKTARPFTKLLS
jgi:hypothetical protein